MSDASGKATESNPAPARQSPAKEVIKPVPLDQRELHPMISTSPSALVFFISLFLCLFCEQFLPKRI